VWNLVLAYKSYNRGKGRKSAQFPHAIYLERLHFRNEYLINRLYPLRETIINLTGATEFKSIAFLSNIYQDISNLTGRTTWITEQKGQSAFGIL